MRTISLLPKSGCTCRVLMRALQLVLGATAAAPVVAQTAGAGADDPPRVVVQGQRASLQTAQAIKRTQVEVVDAVVADDVLKLPDFSVTDALQRITGVQIARDRGDGAGLTVRGLLQVETTLNGREVFTAGSGRTLDFADYPSELVSSIRVYKSSAADHIEGGVGGSIDLRTRRPFDFTGGQTAASARWLHGDLADRGAAQLSGLLSRRWRLDGGGQVGLLFSAALQERAFREDQKGTGSPLARSDLVPGRTVTVPNGTSETSSEGLRRRGAAAWAMQWRVNDAVELYAEGSFAEFRTRQDSQQVNVGASPSFDAASVVLFPGTDDVQRITWTQAPLSILSFARDTVDRTRQAAIGGQWSGGDLALKADLSHTKSFNHLFFSGPFFGGRAASFTHDLSTRLPSTSVSGTDLLDPAALRYTGLALRTRPFEGRLTAAQLDADWLRPQALVHAVALGVRAARRAADNAPGLVFADVSLSGPSAADKPGFVMPNPYGDFFPDESTPSLRHYLVGNLDGARDAAALRQAFGITTPIPAGGNPLGLWRIEETTWSAHVLARFKAGAALDGNLGLRLVRTREAVSGAQSVPATGGVAPIEIDQRYSDWLPSLNLRYAAAPGLLLRLAASKTLTRPNFDQLSPSLTLVPNPVNPSLNQGGAGNPALEPIRADNLDLAIESYLDRASAVHATVFAKRVDGFVTNVSAPEVHGGLTYQVSRPRNSQAATIRGIELGGQHFFAALPGAFSGLGVQANYTYVDSRTPSSILGGNVPLQGLSRHSANLVGIYERGAWSARLACNWRDRFLSGVTQVVGVGALPVYTREYAWLDASLSYRVNERMSITLEGLNLLGTMRRSYHGVATRPQSHWVNDRQVGVGGTIRF